MKSVRCAVYTRKSSEEGLEQDFNSLDAQHEACSAYILSQASEGWQQIAARFDDGGLSGGTLERPALQRLLADVAAGRIDIIVVYKVDRLTRSLLDFAKLVETFDKAGTSFVSVTQAFNTTTSMGRLTLNMLLSFAQFEREVTAERIRDKIAASKARGMWMGGIPPLGYRGDGRSLAVVEEHAALVRKLFEGYLACGNMRLLEAALTAEGVRSPERTTATGKPLGGRPFSRGQLYAMLRNRIYIGEIVHKDRVYPGNHPPIIARSLWDAVQAQLEANIQGARTTRAPAASPLAGRIVDQDGHPLIAVHACKRAGAGGEHATGAGSVRYRYYVTKAVHLRERGGPAAAMRLPASEIERLVAAEIGARLADPLSLCDLLGVDLTPERLHQLQTTCPALAASLCGKPPAWLRDLVSEVRVAAHEIRITLKRTDMLHRLGVAEPPPAPTQWSPPQIVVAARLSRTGRMLRLIDHSGMAPSAAREADPVLVRLVAKARRWWGILAEGTADVRQLARSEGVTPSYVTRVVRLAFLSPAVTEAILTGRIRPGIDGKTLLEKETIPPNWSEQAKRYLA